MHRGEAQEREARDPGHPRSMGKQLERNERLVVVKGQDPIVVTLGGFKENHIRRAGPEHIDARSPGTLHPWLEDLLFFPAQDSPFPGVGIEARESNAGVLDPDPTQGFVEQLKMLHNALGGDARNGFAQGQVARQEHHPQFPRKTNHLIARGLVQARQ